MHRFEVGDLARIVAVPSEWSPGASGEIGMVVTIMSSLQTLSNCVSGREAQVHVVDIKAKYPHTVVAFEPHNLVPIGDCYDKASWDTCIWKPWLDKTDVRVLEELVSDN